MVHRARLMGNGHDQLWLTVWDHDTHARQVYPSWGFEDVGSVRFDLRGTCQTHAC